MREMSFDAGNRGRDHYSYISEEDSCSAWTAPLYFHCILASLFLELEVFFAHGFECKAEAGCDVIA